MSERRYRVVQWATGNVGLRALREVMRHPALELAGVLVYDPVEIDEFANLSQRDSPHMLFQQMNFGQPIASYDASRSAYLLAEFRPALEALAEAANRPVDEWTSTGEVAAASRSTRLAAGELPAGSVAAQRTTVVGKRDGVDVVRFRANWYCTPDVEPAWDLRETGWRVRVRGDASIDVDLRFPVPLEDLGAFTPALTANRPVNAVPYVCAARAGILSAADLPPITPAGPPAVAGGLE